MSRSEAVALRDRLRGEIRHGKLTTTGDPVPLPPDPHAALTLRPVRPLPHGVRPRAGASPERGV